jgi:GGDEF domain-containing protein
VSTAHLGAPALTGDVRDELAVGILVCDGQGAVRAVTTHAAGLLGLADDDLASGARPAGWRLTDDRGTALPDLDTLAAQVVRADTAATVPLVVDGHRRLLLELCPVVLGGVRHALAVVRPVHTDMVRDKGLLDPVTGLPNRVLLFDRLDQALRRARARGTKVSMVLVELSSSDDRTQASTGDRLTAGLTSDHTVARYAVGMFAVVVDHPHGTGAPIAARVAELAACPVRVGWATSDGAHTVHDVVEQALTEVTA